MVTNSKMHFVLSLFSYTNDNLEEIKCIYLTGITWEPVEENALSHCNHHPAKSSSVAGLEVSYWKIFILASLLIQESSWLKPQRPRFNLNSVPTAKKNMDWR